MGARPRLSSGALRGARLSLNTMPTENLQTLNKAAAVGWLKYVNALFSASPPAWQIEPVANSADWQLVSRKL